MEQQNTKPVLLVLAHGDVSATGTLTSTCVARLQTGLEYALAHNCTIMVAAGRSQYRQSQAPMSETMAHWLNQHGFNDVIVRDAPTFTTRGEVWMFGGCEGAKVICSDAGHVRRTQELIREMVGPEAVNLYTYISPVTNMMPWRSKLLEPLKWTAIYLPWWIRVPFVRVLWSLRLNTT